MANRLRDLDVQFVSLVDRAAVRDPVNPTEPQRFLLWKSDRLNDPEGGTMPDTAELSAAVEKAELEAKEAQERLAKSEFERDELSKRVAELEAQVAKATSNDGDEDDDDEAKPTKKADLPPEAREALAKAEAERVALEKRLSESERIVKEERDRRIFGEHVAKAEKELPNLPGSAEEIGGLMKAVSEKLSKDEAEAFERVLKAAEQQLATSALFKTYGADGDGGTSDTESLVNKRAEEIRKADPRLTEYQAVKQALAENPAAAKSYLASVQ